MMTTNPRQTGLAAGDEPRHEDVSFEKHDVSVRAIYGYLVVLTLAVIAAFVACVFILRSTTNFAEESYAPVPPSRAGLGQDYHTLPPEPRLQGVPGHEKDAQQDRRDKSQDDTEANEKLAWLDRNTGIVQIPVADAMKIIVERGLPSTASPSTGEKKK